MLVITPDQDGADVLHWFFKDVKPEVNCMMQKRLLEHIKKNDDMQMKRLKANLFAVWKSGACSSHDAQHGHIEAQQPLPQ